MMDLDPTLADASDVQTEDVRRLTPADMKDIADLWDRPGRRSMKSIAEEWAGFAASVLPPNASDVQRREMRMAFFSGAWVIVTQMQRMGEPDVSEQAGMNQLDALYQECLEFKAEYMKRYAEGN